ncbi:MAG: glycoside hydrolase family 28 protein [Armatimonadota bacterium]
MKYDVKEFGAIGDGKINDTHAIQLAIDTCAQNGGGVVVLHNGVFLSGTVHLKSHVELHLTSSATLLGSTDISHYYTDEKVTYRQINTAVIYACGCTHIAVTGYGTVDGQGGSFTAGPNDRRPVGVRFRDCHNIRLEGVLFKAAASFMIHPIHCSQMRIEGIRIYSMVQPNNDGIDLDGCQDVFISNCHIVSTDDSIALKVMEPGQPCCDIVVTNCILSSLCAAIRIGPDAMEDVMRVTVSNCVMRDTNLNGIKIQESMGAVMRDFVFSNIVMDNVGGPISIRLSGWKLGDTNEWAVWNDSNWEKGQLRNVMFDNIRATGMASDPKLGISITGTPNARPQAITFSNIDITFPGGGTVEEGARREVPDLERAYPECGIFGVLPGYGLYVHHADGITLNNVRFTTATEDKRPAFVFDDAEDIEFAGVKAQGHAVESLIRLQNARSVRIINSRILGDADSLVSIEGESSDIMVDNVDLGSPDEF